MATNPNATEAPPKKRNGVKKYLPTPPSGEQPFAKCREELKGLTDAEIVLLVMDTPAWKEAMVPVLDAVDRERKASRRGGRGGTPVYSAEDIEKALLFQRVCGYRTYKKAHMRLNADRRTREALGFDRANAKKATRYADGVPSQATVSRHLQRFGKERRGDAWDELARTLRDFHVANFPEMQEEMLVAQGDGTAVKTHYTTPIINPKTGKVTNEASVTCPDGGYMPPSAGPDKSGNGWNALPISTHSSVPFVWALPKIHESEPVEATKLVRDELIGRVLPLLGPDRKIGVITFDGAFASPTLRKELRAAGWAENIHHVSHRKESEDRAAKERARRYPIEGYEGKWFSDGHRQLLCACGQGTTRGRFKFRKDMSVACWVEGACDTCGPISITSGKWRLAKNPSRWVRVDPSNPKEDPDLLFGNSLTFDDELSRQFGDRRFGHNEGFHGSALWRRFRITTEKRWFRTVHDARADIGICFSIIHTVAMEQRRRKRAALAASPPGTS
ncbi:MAG: hypothetical protein MSC30_11830 [Gaiellaceae bacterium MAG52_C11]|nr:hypothetical protein [Candidatus Gaiellasilicea maunaloa]